MQSMTVAPQSENASADPAVVLQGLTSSIYVHPALNNAFYRAWIAGPLDLLSLKVFARNYLARTRNTSTMVALSLIGTDDVTARTEIAKNLYSEFGYGDPKKAHINLLTEFLEDLVTRVGKTPFSISELESLPILSSTEYFIAAQRKLYTTPHPAAVVGTLMAQEWLAYSMLTRLYEGVRNYQPCYDDIDDFHSHCEYFYIHIGEAEKEHREQAIRSARLVCSSPADFQELQRGFLAFLDITACFWDGIATDIGAERRLS